MTLQANGFDWDKGNRAKCENHGPLTSVIEGLFTRPLASLPDAERTGGGACSFTVRRKGDELLIWPISARYMHKKEIDAYERENPEL